MGITMAVTMQFLWTLDWINVFLIYSSKILNKLSLSKTERFVIVTAVVITVYIATRYKKVNFCAHIAILYDVLQII